MCGISGKLYFDTTRPVEREVLERMNASLAHRGPDDAGIYCVGAVGLAHRRLSIIDLSPAGHQPMTNEDGTVWIVFNGEIYNFPELRADLVRRGHRFRSRTDTEVILHLYEDGGRMRAAAAGHVRLRHLGRAPPALGPGAGPSREEAALLPAGWDRLPLRLRGEGDPPGSPGRRAPIPPESRVLTYGCRPVGRRLSGCVQAPAGAYLVCENGRPETCGTGGSGLTGRAASEAELARGDPRPPPGGPPPPDRRRAPGGFPERRHRLERVVAMVGQGAGRPVKTFSIGFEERAYNELAYAGQVAAKRSRTTTANWSSARRGRDLSKLVCHYDEPFADSSAIPTYHVSTPGEHVTVALNGDGGDESFAGYDRYRANVLAGSFDRLPGAGLFRHAIRSSLRFLPEGRATDKPAVPRPPFPGWTHRNARASLCALAL